MNMHYIDKKWLENQYQIKSTYEIARDEGVDPTTIQKQLKRFGLNRGHPNKINNLEITPELVDFMTGSMLGDGSLVWGSKDTSAYYSLASSHKEYLVYTEKILNGMNIQLRGSIALSRRGKYEWWHMHSKYYRGALPILRTAWYPDEKKMLLEGAKLNPKSLKTFYLDDGSYVVTRHIRNVSLAMNGFSIGDTKTIRDQIADMLRTENVYARNNKSGPTIEITKRSIIEDFFDLIGPCPHELENVFGYKWP